MTGTHRGRAGCLLRRLVAGLAGLILLGPLPVLPEQDRTCKVGGRPSNYGAAGACVLPLRRLVSDELLPNRVAPLLLSVRSAKRGCRRRLVEDLCAFGDNLCVRSGIG